MVETAVALAPIRFTGKIKSDFFSLVRERADNYFTENNISKNANGFMIFKSIFFVGGTILLYNLIMFGGFGKLSMLGLAIILGTFQAFIGFNVTHDAMHGAYSSNGTVNTLIGMIFNVIGGNVKVWKVSHNLVHHMYTNIPEHDEDLEVAPGLLRLSEKEKKTKIQRYQHFYGFFLYCFASLSWVVKKDYKKFFQDRIGETKMPEHTTGDYLELFGFKFLNYTLFIILPLIFLEVNVWQFLLGFLLMHFAFGAVLGLVFQLAHVVEDVEFPEPTVDNTIEETWAVHQMQTTANFGRKDWLTTFLCGGLNMQIEHHLFPKVCHVHYQKLSEIVQATAVECGVPYIESSNFYNALKSHYRILRKFGIESQQVAA